MSCLCHCLVRFCLPSVIFLTVNLRNLRSRYSLNVQQGAGDPLYVAEGQPKCFDPDIVYATPAEDGYKCAHSNRFSTLPVPKN